MYVQNCSVCKVQKKLSSRVVIFFQGPASAASMMPTAAAVAAAAATAKIQAMDAVASNAVALGKCLIIV